MRVNPYNNDVRSVHPYTDIEMVILYDTNNMVIKYNSGASSDSIRASVKDIERMVEILKNKLGDKMVIDDRSN